MKNGIVILNYNDSDNTLKMIKQIKNYLCIDHVLIVDNNSTDQSFQKLKKYCDDKVEIIKTDTNGGYAKGNNFGIQYLIKNYDVDILMISNPDIIVSEETILKMLSMFEKNSIDVLAPVIVEHNKLSRGWKIPNFWSLLVSNIPFFHRLEKPMLAYSNHHYTDELSQVDVVKGCFFMIRKEAISKIHFFDEHTFLYYEENIMAQKLKNQHFNTFVYNDVQVIHKESQSINQSLNRMKKFKYLKESQFYFEKEILHFNKVQLTILNILCRFNYWISKGISVFRK